MAAEIASNKKTKILVVGLACVDIINVAKKFPEEDTDQRLEDQHVKRGGNATNTSVVLSQLGSQVEWMGTLATDTLAEVILQDLRSYNVLYNHACYRDNCTSPLSCVIINAETGSRTILHANKTLPELDSKDFDQIDLEPYCWIHFEGRNQSQIDRMIQRIEAYNDKLRSGGQSAITVSIEAEKSKSISRDFLGRGHAVFISKEYSIFLGYNSAVECLKGVAQTCNLKEGARVVCAWGEKGAWGLDKDGSVVHSPAYPPIRVVDTLGAGDTFNAGVIHCLSRGRSLQEALSAGCQVAGQKVGVQGFQINAEAIKW